MPYLMNTYEEDSSSFEEYDDDDSDEYDEHGKDDKNTRTSNSSTQCQICLHWNIWQLIIVQMVFFYR